MSGYENYDSEDEKPLSRGRKFYNFLRAHPLLLGFLLLGAVLGGVAGYLLLSTLTFGTLPLISLIALGVMLGLQAAIMLVFIILPKNSIGGGMLPMLMRGLMLLSVINGPALLIALALTTFPVLAFAGTGVGGLFALALVGAAVSFAAVALILFFVDNIRYRLQNVLGDEIPGKPLGGWKIFKYMIMEPLGGLLSKMWGAVSQAVAGMRTVVSKVRLPGGVDQKSDSETGLEILKDVSLKIVFVGAQSVGKTGLVTQKFDNVYYDFSNPTVGASFKNVAASPVELKTEKGTVNSSLKSEIWDISGSKRFASIRPTYIRGAGGIVLAYDITDRTSFDALPALLEEIRTHVGKDIPILLVGCKSDLEDRREVTIAEAKKFASDNNLAGSIETSSKTGKNVAEAFEQIRNAAVVHYAAQIGIKDCVVTNAGAEQANSEIDLQAIRALRPSQDFAATSRLRGVTHSAEVSGAGLPKIEDGQAPSESNNQGKGKSFG